MYNVNNLGKRIASYRKFMGITQEELADRLNITAQAVSKWENDL
ncbi:MAG TPA: helix-turn-helix transcriptional regulator, partial [Clostridiales bacterium]|nr:helix-turn-helix transcriptional regulator [Clostridiales bacterium]